MTSTSATDFRQDFIHFALQTGALEFGEFTTKAGRRSPYFFNTGLFDDGQSLGRLGAFYAKALLASGVGFDMLFGPAYKGITLVAATSIALAAEGRSVPFAFNRKEAKDHGEGGLLVGAPVSGRVVIVDDVITDGASKREAVELIRAAGATPVAVLIAMDRMERVGSDNALSAQSAVQAFEAAYGLPVICIANLDDLMAFLAADPTAGAFRPAVEAYRAKYGAQTGDKPLAA
jgi:orotate phosphoribosyltransferase